MSLAGRSNTIIVLTLIFVADHEPGHSAGFGREVERPSKSHTRKSTAVFGSEESEEESQQCYCPCLNKRKPSSRRGGRRIEKDGGDDVVSSEGFRGRSFRYPKKG